MEDREAICRQMGFLILLKDDLQSIDENIAILGGMNCGHSTFTPYPQLQAASQRLPAEL